MRILSINRVSNVPQNNGTAFKSVNTRRLLNLVAATAITAGGLLTSCSNEVSDEQIQKDLGRIELAIIKGDYKHKKTTEKVIRNGNYVEVDGPHGSVVSINPEYVTVSISGIPVSSIPRFKRKTFEKICKKDGYVYEKVHLYYLIEQMQEGYKMTSGEGKYKCKAIIDAAQQIINQMDD